jgi:AraC family transcriptional regulator, regulatory protein of adaptative response / DNA-3-methyladenine glycosylase II
VNIFPENLIALIVVLLQRAVVQQENINTHTTTTCPKTASIYHCTAYHHAMTLQTDDAYYLAVKARDARFDGCFFTGVTSTGIYCRPVCRVRAPKRENCRFFGHAAQAEAAGFRPCMRCRPELAPHSLIWSTQDASHTLALQAARLLDGALAQQASSVADVAARLGVSDRHLRRIFEAHLGVSPLQYLQTRRLLCAKQLLTDTRLAVADIAHASGFASLRRFNAAFVQHYRLNPTQLRRERAQGAPATTQATSVRLGYRPPYNVVAMLEFFKTRQLNAIESIAAHTHISLPAGKNIIKTLRLAQPDGVYTGWLACSFDEVQCAVNVQISDSLRPALPLLIARLRAALDLDADPKAINAVLDAHFPGTEGLRVPGALDGYEVAVRAVLGQQVTVAAGRTFTQRVVNTFGESIDTPFPELTRLFPAPAVIAHLAPSQLGELGIVKQRQAALIALSQAVDSAALDLNTCVNALQTVEFLKTLPGIGDWTAQYIAMRALRWPDAFPAGDVALHNALGVRDAKNPSRAAEEASQAWRPWRSYAVLRAWERLKT